MKKLTLLDWLTSSGRYPWRAKHSEVTEELKKRAEEYLVKLNAVCLDLHILNPRFSSGFRPLDVNKKTPGASKKSHHITGNAGDLVDTDGSIGFSFRMNTDVLEKHGLYLEDPSKTKGWVHTQSIAPLSGKRIFLP